MGALLDQLITTDVNLSTRAIVVTQHGLSAITGVYYPVDPVFIPVSFGELHLGNEASAVNTEARAQNDKCCADR